MSDANRKKLRLTVAVALPVLGLGLIAKNLFAGGEPDGEVAFAAASTGKVDVLRAEIERFPAIVRKYDVDGNTLLYVAAANGRPEAVDVVLAHGGEPDVPNAEGDTPLAAAVRADRNQLATVRRLLERGASVARPLPDGRNVLHVAAGRRGANRELIALLARDRAAAQARDAKGLTPAQLARQAGAADVAIALGEAK